MNTDIRIDGEFLDHPKTQKLIRRLGLEGLFSLQALWIWCAKNRPDGDLSGMDDEDIAIAARWTGNAGDEAFVGILADLRWLDPLEGGGYALHDWAEHQKDWHQKDWR